jgi:arylsulfatase A-like enzyme
MRTHLLLVLLLPLSLAGSQAAAPNVLFIAIDDLRPELGCYGADYAQSPHLDDFAKSAVTFNKHYVQVATCGASRYALLTGRSPRTSGALGNGAATGGKTAIKDEVLPGAQTMPELFRRSGYRTSVIGKISHSPDGRVFAYNGKGDGRPELPGAWDEFPTPFGQWKRGWGTFFAYAGGVHREDGGGNRDLMEFVAEKDSDLPDGMMADTAIAKLAELKAGGKPFFLGLGFFKPHLPFVATKADWDAFENVKIPAPADAQRFASPYHHGSGEFFKYAAPYDKKPRPLPADSAQSARRAYLACVRYVDRQVGKVLAELDKLELAETTVVVVWGDHGWHLGDAQLWGKHSPFERANRSVLMVRAPGCAQGVRTDALAETVDLYPTLLELCKPSFSKTQHPLDGVSLVPILRGQKDSVRDHAVSYWRDAVSVRSADYRLVAKVKAGKVLNTELYDLRKDIDSVENIAAQNPDIVKSLSTAAQ